MTAVVIGAAYASLPPNCSSLIANGVTYERCGSTYYQPQYVGSQVQYIVVEPPR
jgi:hypothetical protein